MQKYKKYHYINYIKKVLKQKDRNQIHRIEDTDTAAFKIRYIFVKVYIFDSLHWFSQLFPSSKLFEENEDLFVYMHELNNTLLHLFSLWLLKPTCSIFKMQSFKKTTRKDAVYYYECKTVLIQKWH